MAMLSNGERNLHRLQLRGRLANRPGYDRTGRDREHRLRHAVVRSRRRSTAHLDQARPFELGPSRSGGESGGRDLLAVDPGAL